MTETALRGSLLEQDRNKEQKTRKGLDEAKPLEDVIQQTAEDIASVFAKQRKSVVATE